MASAGVLVTLGLVILDLWRAAELARAHTDHVVTSVAAAVQERYNSSFAYQQALTAFFIASERVEPDEFARFLSLVKAPPFIAVQHVPWVTAGERKGFDRRLVEEFGVGRGIWELDPEGKPSPAGARPDYFPILLTYPSDAAQLRGFDIGSEPIRRRALQTAAASGQAAATGPVALLQRQERGFVVMVPIRAADRCASGDDCPTRTEGFTTGVYALSDLLAQPLEQLSPDVALFVFADRGAGARSVFQRAARDIPWLDPARDELLEAGAHWRPLRIAQQEWQLAFVRAPSFPLSLESAALLSLGLGLTLALVVGHERALKHIGAVQDSERQRTTLISNLPGFVYRAANTPSWPMIYISEGVHALTGYRPADLLAGTPTYGDLIVEQDRERVWNEVQAAFAQRRRFQIEYQITTADKQTRWVWEQGCGIYSDDGALLFLEGFITDITERRRIQEQLAQAEKQEAIGQLTGGLAHDFNNALGVVIGNLDLASARVGDDEKLRQYVDSALRAALRGASVTKSLLGVARRQALETKDFDLNAAIRDMMSLIRQAVGPATRVIEALSDQPLVARGDPGGLSNAVLNLVINARDAMPNGGQLVVETAARTIRAGYSEKALLSPGQYVMVAIRDSGSGMSSEVADRAFEPYFTTKERGKGTGLGLAMVHGYAHQSGGTATIYSRPGKGTTVRIYLPAGQAAGAPDGAPAAKPTTRAERILIVDDEAELAQVAAEWLEGLGYTAEVVTDPEMALSRLGKDRWDLLLTDILMPGMDGIELARRAVAARPGLRVLLSTGFSEKAARLPQGALRILDKPYRRHELASAVQDVLAAPPPHLGSS